MKTILGLYGNPGAGAAGPSPRRPTSSTMKTLLHIKASLFADHGQSSQLSDAYVGNWRARHADGRVITRDFARQPMPHLDGAAFQAFLTPPTQRRC